MDVEQKQINLPLSVVSPVDVARILRELSELDEYFRQMAIRSDGETTAIPRYSRVLDDLVTNNQINLLQEQQRQELIHYLKHLQDSAPTLHVSFSVDPPGTYVQKIVEWMRANLQGDILVRVGLQPNIGAGCVVRSTNHSFDFSLRQYFESKHEFFIEKLHEVLINESDVPEEIAVEATNSDVASDSEKSAAADQPSNNKELDNGSDVPPEPQQAQDNLSSPTYEESSNVQQESPQSEPVAPADAKAEQAEVKTPAPEAETPQVAPVPQPDVVAEEQPAAPEQTGESEELAPAPVPITVQTDEEQEKQS